MRATIPNRASRPRARHVWRRCAQCGGQSVLLLAPDESADREQLSRCCGARQDIQTDEGDDECTPSS